MFDQYRLKPAPPRLIFLQFDVIHLTDYGGARHATGGWAVGELRHCFQRRRRTARRYVRWDTGLLLAALVLVGCEMGPASPLPLPTLVSSEYQIGPGDSLNVFVWRNPELSLEAPVRPDGRISIPLVEDVVAIGKTPSALAREIEQKLSKYVNSPIVTVIPRSFVGPFDQQVRVVGEAVVPRALPYRANMTVLDAMIQVGGLTKYAAGNRAELIRTINNSHDEYPLRLANLINDGDISWNVPLAPGDIIIIPQSYF
jgi:polysaccharide export outer membrane protein